MSKKQVIYGLFSNSEFDCNSPEGRPLLTPTPSEKGSEDLNFLRRLRGPQRRHTKAAKFRTTDVLEAGIRTLQQVAKRNDLDV